jgi:predicted enzyme related to lactoylglutathione lyase
VFDIITIPLSLWGLYCAAVYFGVTRASGADHFSARVTACEGTIIHPKMTIPGAGYLISCKDTEGNTFSIMQSDESAK